MGDLAKRLRHLHADPVARAVLALEMREGRLNGAVAGPHRIIFGVREVRVVLLVIGRIRQPDFHGQPCQFLPGLFLAERLDGNGLVHTSSKSLVAAALASSVTVAPDSMRAISSCRSC